MSHKREYTKVDIVSPEKVQLNVLYTFNLSPSDDHQFYNKPDDGRVKSMIRWFTTYVVSLFTARVDVYMEISRSGRLHFHGTIEFRNLNEIREFYLHAIHDIVKHSHLEIDTIVDPFIWHNYCIKSQHIIKCNIKSSTLRKVEESFIVQYKNYFSSVPGVGIMMPAPGTKEGGANKEVQHSTSVTQKKDVVAQSQKNSSSYESNYSE